MLKKKKKEKQIRTVTIPLSEYNRMRENIKDLTSTTEALFDALNDMHRRNNELRGTKDEIESKYRSLLVSYRNIAKW